MLSTSLLKVVVFFGVWAIVWLPVAFSVAYLISWQPSQPLTTRQKLILLASLYILVPVILWWKITTEGLSFAELGLIWQLDILKSLGLGLFLSLAGLGITFSLESFLGLITWRWQNSKLLISLIVPILFLGLGISLVEELVFRGYVFSTLRIEYSDLLTATISSIIFALLHLIWERKATIPQIPGLWLMGMVLVQARLLDHNSLGLAWGLHTGWIWGLSCLDSAQLITYTAKEKSWITGIYHQPLAGVAGIFCLMITGFTLWLFPEIINTF